MTPLKRCLSLKKIQLYGSTGRPFKVPQLIAVIFLRLSEVLRQNYLDIESLNRKDFFLFQNRHLLTFLIIFPSLILRNLIFFLASFFSNSFNPENPRINIIGGKITNMDRLFPSVQASCCQLYRTKNVLYDLHSKSYEKRLKRQNEKNLGSS